MLEGDPQGTGGTPGVNLEASPGSSESSSTHLHEVSYGASNLDATGGLTVIARAGGGDIDITGSQTAAHNVTQSANDVRFANPRSLK